MKLSTIVSILFYIICLSYTASNQPNSKKLDDYFLRKMKNSGIVGLQVGMIKNGQFVWQGSYGKINVTKEEKVNDSTLFMIASSSKPVTALGILKLCSDGVINLDDPINDHLPFAIHNPYFPETDITVRMLLSHVSSFKDNWNLLDPLYTVKEGGDSPIVLKDLVSKYFVPEKEYYDSELNFHKKAPGKGWSYSNMGYATLGYLIECVIKRSFDEYMQQEIFKPLGMKNSYWFLKNIPHENIARPHILAEKKNDSIQVLPHYGYPDYPDGQLRTTVADYAKLIELILNKGKIDGRSFIKPEYIEAFLEVQYGDVHKWQALAWNYNEFENVLYYLLMPRLPSHTGGDPGVASVISFDPEKQSGAIVFVNSPPNTFRGGKIFYLDMVRKLLKGKY